MSNVLVVLFLHIYIFFFSLLICVSHGIYVELGTTCMCQFSHIVCVLEIKLGSLGSAASTFIC